MGFRTKEDEKAYNRAYYKRNREAIIAHVSEWYSENKEHKSEYDRKYRASGRGRTRQRSYRRSYMLEKKYGLSHEQWESMFEAQGRACAICKATDPGGVGNWHTDHCHTSGVVREILCNSCNLGIGHFNDNPDLLKTVIAYLEKHRSIKTNTERR